MAQHVHRWLIWHGGILLISNLNEINGCMIKNTWTKSIHKWNAMQIGIKIFTLSLYGVLGLHIEGVCIIDKSSL